MLTIIVIILILALVFGGFGVYRGSSTGLWGGGLLGLILVVVLILYLTGNLNF